MSSVDATATSEADAAGTEPPETDEGREALLARWRDELGDAVVGSHIRPGDALWVRVDRAAWREAAAFAQGGLDMAFFDFLSAIDWLPSPFGRDMDSQEDIEVHGAEPKELPPTATGYAGGETRFQVLARVYDPTAAQGVILKVDVPDDDLSIDTWTHVYAGADWHERETWEMYGIDFVGHPGLTHLYLPSDFEGFPLRKDFPLLARRVKPWPGIVDVEPMPGSEDEAGGDQTGGDA